MRRIDSRTPLMMVMALGILVAGAPAAGADPLQPPTLGDLVQDTTGEVSEAVRIATEPAAGPTSPVTDTIDGVTDIVDTVTDRATDTVETTTDTVRKTTEDAADTVTRTTERAGDAVTRTTERTTEAVEEVTERVSDTVDTAAGTTTDAADPVPTPVDVAQDPPEEESAEPVHAPAGDSHTSSDGGGGGGDDDRSASAPAGGARSDPRPAAAPAGRRRSTDTGMLDLGDRLSNGETCVHWRHHLEDRRTVPVDLPAPVAAPRSGPGSAPLGAAGLTGGVTIAPLDRSVAMADVPEPAPRFRLPSDTIALLEVLLLLAIIVGAVGYTMALAHGRAVTDRSVTGEQAPARRVSLSRSHRRARPEHVGGRRYPVPRQRLAARIDLDRGCGIGTGCPASADPPIPPSTV